MTTLPPEDKTAAISPDLLVVNFSGHQTTMQASGPWGVNTAFTATTSDSGAVTALWSGAKNQQVFFNLSCKGGIIGYLRSVQVFAI